MNINFNETPEINHIVSFSKIIGERSSGKPWKWIEATVTTNIYRK